MRSDRFANVVLFLGIAFWLLNAILRWSSSAFLGHDEARYALDARDLLAGEATRFPYSGSGMAVVAMPGVLLGGSELALRALPLLLGLGFLASAWYVARLVSGPQVASWTVAVLAGGRQFATYSSELLSDLPSSALVLASLAILIRGLRDERGPPWWMVALGPMLAAAFYVRYGSCVPIAIFGALFLLAYPRWALQRPMPLVVALAILLLLLIPHALHSASTTGSVLGVLKDSGEYPGPGQGLVPYIARPLAWYGPVLFPLMVIGLVGVRRSRLHITLAVGAACHVVVLAFATQPQPRYVFVATVILLVLGIDAIVRLTDRRSGTRYPLVALALASTAVTWIATLVSASHYRSVRAKGAAPTQIASEVIKGDAAGTRCEVMSHDRVAKDLTRLEWYSGCRAVMDPTPSRSWLLYEVHTGDVAPDTEGAVLVAYLPTIIQVWRRD